MPAFPSGEAVFSEEPPLVPSPDFGHYALQATLWGMVVICAAFVVVGCVRTFAVILDYAR